MAWSTRFVPNFACGYLPRQRVHHAQQDAPEGTHLRQRQITQRGPDRWLLRLSHRIDPATGKRIRQHVTVTGSRRDAERALNRLVASAEALGPAATASPRLTLDAWVSEYWQTADVSEATRATALQSWRLFSGERLRGTPLRDVSVALVEHRLRELRDTTSAHTGRPLADRTRAMWLAGLRTALEGARRQGLIVANPARGPRPLEHPDGGRHAHRRPGPHAARGRRGRPARGTLAAVAGDGGAPGDSDRAAL
jgi:hypothetical protein